MSSKRHPYIALDVDRYRLVAQLAIAAVPIAVALNAVMGDVLGDLAPYLTPPGALLLFGAAFWLYDEKLWRWRPRGLRLSSIPDLNGEWEGTVTLCPPTPGGEPHESLNCRLKIRQSWTRMLIEFKSPMNTSRSVSAVVTVDEQDKIKALLQYHYYVEWKDPSRNHGGSQRLSPDEDWDGRSDVGRLSGDFYTDRNFLEHGELEIRRTQNYRAEEPAREMV